MPAAPQVVVLDVNETLSDMSPMRARWEAVGAPGPAAQQWFAEVLRDGFALAAAGGSARFAEIAEAVARRLLAGNRSGAPTDAGDLDRAVEHVLEGFSALEPHPDVPDGLRALRAQGIRLVTLSNGAPSVAEGLLRRAGLLDQVDLLLSVEDAARWKPAKEAYDHALIRCGVDAADAMLVAVHPWDVDGARRAGLQTGWINRTGEPYPRHFRPADVVAGSLTGLADALRDADGSAAKR